MNKIITPGYILCLYAFSFVCVWFGVYVRVRVNFVVKCRVKVKGQGSFIMTCLNSSGDYVLHISCPPLQASFSDRTQTDIHCTFRNNYLINLREKHFKIPNGNIEEQNLAF